MSPAAAGVFPHSNALVSERSEQDPPSGANTSESGNDKQTILRSSSSGFAWGELVFSHYKSSCLRWILISSHRSYEIDSKYTRLGKINEDLHEEELLRKSSHYVRELEVTQPSPIDGIPNVGHIDFLVTPADSKKLEVHELKHVQSKNVYREVIKKGLYIVDNLAQTVNYMLQAKTEYGLLKYSYYEKDELKDARYFDVAIDDFGRVNVDKKPTKFTVGDQLNHQRQAAMVLRDQTIAQRPYLGETPYVGACHWCPVSAACAQWDRGAIEGAVAFIELAKQQIEEKEKSHGGKASDTSEI